MPPDPQQNDSHRQEAKPELLVIPPLRARVNAAGAFLLSRRFISGMDAYARYWPGDVSVLLRQGEFEQIALHPVEIHPSEASFDIQLLPENPEQRADRIRSAAVVLIGLIREDDVEVAELCAKLGVPLVCISVNSLQARKQQIDPAVRNPLRRLWRKCKQVRLEWLFRRAVRIAAGVQCNGTPTFAAYRKLNPRPMLFFDGRTTHDMLVSDDILKKRTEELLAGRPLRLAFSGRLIAIKGVDHLPLIAAELDRLGVPFVMDICGGGELEDQLASQIHALKLSDRVRLRGVLDFREELIPLISQQADLFVCCHRQGDPSCTYLETMGCGTPVAGYENDAFRGVVEESGVGWLSPVDNWKKLAELIAELHADRTVLAEAAFAAVAFASRHTFEETMKKRVAHLLACATDSRPAGVQGPCTPAATVTTGSRISATEPDWSRERCRRWWDPSRRLLKSIRCYQRWRNRGIVGRLLCIWSVLWHRFWSVIAAADIPLDCQLGGGLMIPHPNGVVIHPEATIGPNCLVFHQVTIGTRGPRQGAPTIGGHVVIGAGAKILGPVSVGDHARIGANAVVISDVPPGAVAVGVPARIVSKGAADED